MEGKVVFIVLACVVLIHFVAAEAPPVRKATGQDLKTAESSRLFSWGSGNKYPYPSTNWHQGNGYYYPNPNVNQYYPNTGFYNPGFNYPNYGFGNNGYFGGFPGGYSGGFPGGYSGYSGFGNGYSTGYNGLNSGYRNTQDLPQQTTGRGGYIYKR